MAVNGYFGGDENVLKLIGDDYTTVNILKTNELYALSWVKCTVGGLYLNIAFYLKVGGHGRKWQGWNFHQLQIKNFGKLANTILKVWLQLIQNLVWLSANLFIQLQEKF